MNQFSDQVFNPDFSTFISLIKTAGLVDLLSQVNHLENLLTQVNHL